MTRAYGEYRQASASLNAGDCTGTFRAYIDYSVHEESPDSISLIVSGGGINVGSKIAPRKNNDWHLMSMFSNKRVLEVTKGGDHSQGSLTTSNRKVNIKESGIDKNYQPYWNSGYTSSITAFDKPIELFIPKDKTATYLSVMFSIYIGMDLGGLGGTTFPLIMAVTVNIPAKPSYTVSYNPVGGSSVSSQKKWWGENLTLSTTRPTRLGYIFKGWATSATGSVAYQPGAVYTANAPLILYAVWEPVYTVKYDLNGHGVPSTKPADQIKSYNVDLKLSTVVPQPESVVWSFLGWATFNGAIAPQYQPGDVYSTNASTTLYAVWQQNVDTELTLAHVNRVYPDSEDIIDDTSEFIRVTAQLYVESVWETRTRISITSERSDGVKGPSAVTIRPSDVTDKTEDIQALNHQIVWRSHTDDLRFLEDWQYNIHIQADTYKVEHQSGEVNSSLALPNPFGDRMEADTESRTLDASLIPENCYAAPTPFEVTDENSIDACVIFADRESSTLEDGSLEIVLTKPANPTPRAYIKPGTGIDIQYTVSHSSLDENGNPNIEVFTDSISVNIPNLPRTIPHGSEQLVFEVAMPELPEDAVVDSVRINSPSVMLEPNPVKAVLDVSNTDDLITVTVGYPEDISGKTVYIPEQYNSVDFLEREASGPLVYSAATDILLTSAEFIMDFHKDGHGAGIGRKAPEKGLDVGWKTKFYDAVEAAKELVVKGVTTLQSLIVEKGAVLKSSLEVAGTTSLKSTLAVSGETSIPSTLKTGNITMVHGAAPVIQRNGIGSSWIKGRDNALVRNTTASSTGSWYPLAAMRTCSGGSWEMGTFGTSNRLLFAYTLDSDYNANNNRVNKSFGIDPSQSYEGIITETGYIRAPPSGIIPSTSGGNGYLGTSGWPWNQIYSKGYYINGVHSWMVVNVVRASINSGNVAAGANPQITGTVTVPSGTYTVIPVVESPPANLMVNGITVSRSGTTVTVHIRFKNNLSKTASGTCYVRILCFI